jgi:hypothetical protein
MTPALVAGGREEAAREILRDALRDVRRSAVPLAENHLFSVLGAVEHLRGRAERAGRLLAVARHLADATRQQIPFRTPGSLSLYRHYLPLVRGALGRDEGQAMTREAALAYAGDGLE